MLQWLCSADFALSLVRVTISCHTEQIDAAILSAHGNNISTCTIEINWNKIEQNQGTKVEAMSFLVAQLLFIFRNKFCQK